MSMDNSEASKKMYFRNCETLPLLLGNGLRAANWSKQVFVEVTPTAEDRYWITVYQPSAVRRTGSPVRYALLPYYLAKWGVDLDSCRFTVVGQEREKRQLHESRNTADETCDWEEVIENANC